MKYLLSIHGVKVWKFQPSSFKYKVLLYILIMVCLPHLLWDLPDTPDPSNSTPFLSHTLENKKKHKKNKYPSLRYRIRKWNIQAKDYWEEILKATWETEQSNLPKHYWIHILLAIYYWHMAYPCVWLMYLLSLQWGKNRK